jgi:hypothetical protein
MCWIESFVYSESLCVNCINDYPVMPDTDQMQKQVSSIYHKLRSLRMDQHARDFWRIRAGKQQQQMLQDPLLHEYTALTQYMQWHSSAGARLPSFLRGTAKCIAHIEHKLI